MKHKYALFFDIDGTLVSFRSHEIPVSTIQALTMAKANGHRVYIATGRPVGIITNLGAIAHLIDGFITTITKENLVFTHPFVLGYQRFDISLKWVRVAIERGVVWILICIKKHMRIMPAIFISCTEIGRAHV